MRNIRQNVLTVSVNSYTNYDISDAGRRRMSVKIVIGYLKFLYRVFQHYQVDWQKSDLLDPELKERFKLALESQSSDVIDVNDYVLLLEFTQRFFKRPVAFVLAEHATLQDIGLIGYLASTSIDLKQAMQLFGEYYSLLYQQTNPEKLIIEQQEDQILLFWNAPNPEWQLFFELNIALIYKITESIVEHELVPPHYIGLGYPMRFQSYHYEKFFKTIIKSTPQKYILSFPIQNLQIRSIAADLELNEVLSTQAKHSLQTSKNDVNSAEILQGKVKRLIEQGLNTTESLQTFVAKQLYCSERTLQRQIKDTGVNFQDLVDEVRYEKAKLYLKKGMNFSEVATLLKYADQSAFGRAFKRWSGQTPKQFINENK